MNLSTERNIWYEPSRFVFLLVTLVVTRSLVVNYDHLWGVCFQLYVCQFESRAIYVNQEQNSLYFRHRLSRRRLFQILSLSGLLSTIYLSIYPGSLWGGTQPSSSLHCFNRNGSIICYPWVITLRIYHWSRGQVWKRESSKVGFVCSIWVSLWCPAHIASCMPDGRTDLPTWSIFPAP